MHDSSPTNPVFVGGTLTEHIMFVVALCRYQHHSLTLALVHYVTWSAMHVALYSLALALFGPIGAIVLGVAITGWALNMNLVAGLVFGLLELACATCAFALVPFEVAAGIAMGRAVLLAVGGIIASLAVEVGCHLVLQGYPPSPPARATHGMPVIQKLGFVLYFVITFGMFFLTLDLAMRLCGLRPNWHRDANAIAAEWHRDAVDIVRKPRELQWHRRAIVEQTQ